jgi:hypothetical protein
MSNIIPAKLGGHTEVRGSRMVPVSRAVGRALSQLEGRTLLRMASVQGEGMVQGEKVQEIDHLSRTAMTGQAMLSGWADTVARNDPLLRDELRFFTDVARIGKGEIIADTIDSFCRESRS